MKSDPISTWKRHFKVLKLVRLHVEIEAECCHCGSKIPGGEIALRVAGSNFLCLPCLNLHKRAGLYDVRHPGLTAVR